MTTELKQKALAFLKGQKVPVRTLEVAKHCCGKGASRKSINKHLYALLKEKKVEKIADSDGSNPRWKAVPSQNSP
jgi:hypothetical protein